MSETKSIASKPLHMTIAALTTAYRNGGLTPRALVEQLHLAYRSDSNPVWIHLLSMRELEPYLTRLDNESPDSLPLYGIPFAIKDNIDLAGVPTTAACPDFAYTPEKSATVVQLLLGAGAIPMGKTNLDQFATGLVGVRSPEPWGPCRNALNPDYISGGSSSGSAVAVAKGWVSFALGTDTAGSGRVPAALNNIVGLKPTCGLLSAGGVVPACRSIDTVSIFANTCDDANRVFDQVARFDSEDAYSRENPYNNGPRYFNRQMQAFHFAVPEKGQLEFFGDEDAREQFAQAVVVLESIGGIKTTVDFTPFLEAARLLYEGPYVTERYLATQPLIDEKPEALLPVLQTIIGGGRRHTAAQAYTAAYRLKACGQKAGAVLDRVDVAVTPTAATAYTIEQVLADPIRLNSNLGYYTNFMNLLDYAAVAVPTGKLKAGVGFGVTLFHRAFSDKRLLSVAARLQDALAVAPGTGAVAYQAEFPATPAPCGTIDVVVCGAHLDGLPLNWQLRERGAVLVQVTQTAPCYRFYALAGGPPKRPGLVRDSEGGDAVEVEVWRLPAEAFGSFVAEIPAPLGIGKVELDGGSWQTGFICEPHGLEGAEEITRFGGWRAYWPNGEPG